MSSFADLYMECCNTHIVFDSTESQNISQGMMLSLALRDQNDKSKYLPREGKEFDEMPFSAKIAIKRAEGTGLNITDSALIYIISLTDSPGSITQLMAVLRIQQFENDVDPNNPFIIDMNYLLNIFQKFPDKSMQSRLWSTQKVSNDNGYSINAVDQIGYYIQQLKDIKSGKFVVTDENILEDVKLSNEK